MTTLIQTGASRQFVELYTSLIQNRRWWWDLGILQHAAMAGMISNHSPESLADKTHTYAQQIKKQAGWLSELNCPMRFVLAMLIAAHGDSPDRFLSEYDRTKELFRMRKVKQSGLHEAMAIALLYYFHSTPFDPTERITVERVEKFYSTFQEMSQRNWWMTGVDDYPMVAVLSKSFDSLPYILDEVDSIYQQLQSCGFWKSNALHSAAHLLAFSGEDCNEAANRFYEIREAFRTRRLYAGQNAYNGIAMLALVSDDVDRITSTYQEVRADIISIRPKPNRSIANVIAFPLSYLEMSNTPASHMPPQPVGKNRKHHRLADDQRLAVFANSLANVVNSIYAVSE